MRFLYMASSAAQIPDILDTKNTILVAYFIVNTSAAPLEEKQGKLYVPFFLGPNIIALSVLALSTATVSTAAAQTYLKRSRLCIVLDVAFALCY